MHALFMMAKQQAELWSKVVIDQKPSWHVNLCVKVTDSSCVQSHWYDQAFLACQGEATLSHASQFICGNGQFQAHTPSLRANNSHAVRQDRAGSALNARRHVCACCQSTP